MGPLAGVRVVEMAGLAPAPFAAMMLADLGAEVIRVARGDGGAALSPPAGPLNRGKTSLALDLRRQPDLELLLEMTDRADVFIEGNRPGAAERLGIGPDVLCRRNPRLVYGRLTGWGQDGPLAPTAGHDINYIALSGALDLVGRAGERPVPPVNLLADFAGGGMLLVVGVLAALQERTVSGRGQVIDAAMTDGSALLTAFVHGMRAAGLWNSPRGENLFDGAAPFYDTYECADGLHVAVGCVEPQFFAEMLRLLELDPDTVPGQLDFDQWPRLRTLVADRLRTRTRDEWTEVFAGSDACVTPVLSPWEAHTHPHNRDRSAFVEVDGLRQPAPAPRFARTPLPTPGPQVDDTAAVRDRLAAWGVDAEVPAP